MNESTKVLYQIPESAGEPFRPSNGTEGDMFQGAFCARCTRQAEYRRTHDGMDACPIMCASYVYSVRDPGYPKEWVFDGEGWPVCTAFERES